MKHIRFDQDIKPLSEFRANAASFIQQIQETGRPMVLTQRGRSSAVLVEPAQYDSMLEELELLRELQLADEQFARGEGIDHETAKARLRKVLKRDK
ncbi:MAG: type II toxin-antitoxin system Phd/YefM family antitoxin [Phycisphaerales bacterium]|nr:type II toxin-antitoxin system Phd/YefM family antitoxin [Phycisphaerales bacterium]